MIQSVDERLWSILETENTVGNDLLDAVDHGILVSNLAGLLAYELGCEDEFCNEMMTAGLVHDIGKLQIGQYLYGRNDGAMRIEEVKYVRLHPTLGYEKLKKYGGFSELVMEGVYHHHENYDGTGYPGNLRGDKIPFASRILRICDVYAALISERPYRAAFESDAAVEMMIDEVKHFDMKIFLAFLNVVHSEDMKDILQFAKCVNQKIRMRNKNEEIADVMMDEKQLREHIEKTKREQFAV